MSSLSRVALLAFCLSACDSAQPEAPATETPAFVGTWTSQTYGDETYATLSQSQVALDPFSPATGEVLVEGAYSASLRYVTSRYVSRDFGETVTSYTITSAPLLKAGTPFIVMNVSPRFADIGVQRGLHTSASGGSTGYFIRFPVVTPPVAQSGDTLHVGLNVYEESPTGPSVTVRGMLVLPRRRIEAGVETRMNQTAFFTNSDAVTRTIRADGTVSESGPNAALRSGTWSAGSDSTVTFRLGGLTRTHRYRVTGSTLRLASTEPFDCDAACRARVEDASDLRPGSVRSARLVFVSTYTRDRS